MHRDDLKPCPFCSGEAVQCGSNELNPRHWIMCRECHACPGGDVDKLDDAISAWNCRAALPEQTLPVRVEIKKLEWRRQAPYHVARVFGNVYAVEAWDGGVTLSGIIGRREFKTVEAAKAAAQSDYETRIRAALVDNSHASEAVVSLSREEAEKLAARLEFDASWDKCGDGYYSIKRQLASLRPAEVGYATDTKGNSDE